MGISTGVAMVAGTPCIAKLHRLAQSMVVLPVLLSACHSAYEPTSPNLEGVLVEQNPFDAAPAYFTSFGSKSGVLKIHCFSVNHIVDIKYERLEYFNHGRMSDGSHKLFAKQSDGQTYTFLVEPDPTFQCIGSGFDGQGIGVT